MKLRIVQLTNGKYKIQGRYWFEWQDYSFPLNTLEEAEDNLKMHIKVENEYQKSKNEKKFIKVIKVITT